MRILAADDDPTLRLIVKGGLGAGGHDVVVVESGAEAWDLLKKEHFPVVITDWMMPGLDGLQLTSLIRKAQRESYTYVIMLTGKSKREDFVKAIQAGVDAFLPKPLDGIMLEAQVNIAARILGLQAHAKKLESMMTVCAHCKRVRDHGKWVGLDEYVSTNLNVKQSHGYCPNCFDEKVAPEMRALGISTEGLKYP
jgi:sigma-B regulation protein RsbU (phosphoserine phosphatase)